MRLQVSRTLAITSSQLVVNFFLASWLFSEYLHNPFMRQYLSNLWAANGTIFSIGIVLLTVVVLGSYMTLFRKMSSADVTESASSAGSTSSTGLRALDVCPVCNNEVKELSPNRYQCRSCHRYFKK